MITKKFIERIATEPIYLWDDETETYVRSIPKKGYKAKKPGGKEFEIDGSSDIVMRAVFSEKELTKQEYESG